ncbi:unnamed protein product [Lactuca virosa]|uniref:Reverse transcriptase zinc-binding domain-containing protein n=1 Tax=Lactuca virosa TaxID=75947 RepID=A0AAU9P189_9ASTR|nr:unnamed protein product [Lactuca virosa]
MSGLNANLAKSQIFFSCVKPNMRRIILGILPFDVGKFPFKYLEVPMCITKLFCRDCKQLVEKIKMRVFNWKSKFLSFAGRLHLINVVLTSIHVYWASIFKIHVTTIKEIEKLCRSYLWANVEVVKGKAKASWNNICKHKEYGGLGVKDLRKWNDALLAKHVWNVIKNKNSLWVQCVRRNYIRDRCFWDIKQKKNMNWTWERILEVRKAIRPHVVSCVGNGMNTSLWHDWWHPIGILSAIISTREWVSKGFNDMYLVSDVMVNDHYLWPVEWMNDFPGLRDGPMFCNNADQLDVTVWRDKNGISKHFLSKQDQVKCWEVKGNLLCPFCLVTNDSHDHLFFKCEFSHLIWSHFCNKMDLCISYDDWNELILKLCGFIKGKAVESLVKKIVLASCVAHIWKERNSRLFSNISKLHKEVIFCIEKEVQLKLLGLRKKSIMVNDKDYKNWGIHGRDRRCKDEYKNVDK